MRGENAAAIRAEVEHNAASIATAFENQLDALYAAESMDLSADLTVLQNMLKGPGSEQVKTGTFLGILKGRNHLWLTIL